MSTDVSLSEFREKFRFAEAGAMLVGCEREFFLINHRDEIVPLAYSVMQSLRGDPRFGYELSACQMEAHVGPVPIDQFHHASTRVDDDLRNLLSGMFLRPRFQTVGPVDMPLDIYPDPTGRYQRITADMPKEILSAACRVTGTHVHVGMPDHETALRIYNGVITHMEDLCAIADLTNGERRSIYHVMARDNMPRQYVNWEELFQFYVAQGYVADPRKCWHLIRLSVHGTIEFRMFDNTHDLDLITRWVSRCHELCLSYL